MKNLHVTICFLFVALIMAIALTGCSNSIKDCQYYVDNNINDFTECAYTRPVIDCTTDTDCENKNGGEY